MKKRDVVTLATGLLLAGASLVSRHFLPEETFWSGAVGAIGLVLVVGAVGWENL